MIEYSTNQQNLITKNELLELSEITSPHCISMFIPTHRAGKETLAGIDALNLKNQLKEVKSKLKHQGMSDLGIENLVKPVEDLIKDSQFWSEQSDGLAVFLSEDLFRVYTIPVHFTELNYLSNEFYVKPIIPLLNGDGFYYILTLKKDDVKFYEGTRFSITEIVVKEIVPNQLEDRVGYDHKQKSFQFRTQQGNQGAGTFHGHQDEDSTEKEELLKYFRAVNKGLMSLLNHNQNPPLVIYSQEFYFPLYKEVNTYKTLYPEHISGNPSDDDIFLLHERAWNLLAPYFSKNRKDKLEKYAELSGSGKATADIEAIFSAAFEGRIDTLFLEKNADMFGVYNPETKEVRIEEAHQAPNVSLTNLLAVKVLKSGGTVFLQEKDTMPDKVSPINALFRY